MEPNMDGGPDIPDQGRVMGVPGWVEFMGLRGMGQAG